MSDDRRRLAQYSAERDETLARWMPNVVHPFSAALRPALDRAGGRRAVTRTVALRSLPVVSLESLGNGHAHVLEPGVDEVSAHGSVGARMRLAGADLFGRRKELAARDVDPTHKPVVWTAVTVGAGDRATTLFVASTASDLDRLAALGRRGLSISGVRPADRIVVVDPAGAGIAPWQFLAGARDAGIAILHLDRLTQERVIRSAGPTVVAGSARSLVRVVEKGLPESVRRLIVHDGQRPDPAQVEVLRSTGLPWAEWWVPDGARAAWVRCQTGEGFHTWPTHEAIEIVDDTGAPAEVGRLIWSAVGWHGSVWLRVDTGTRASIATDECRCGRTTPRVIPVEQTTRRRTGPMPTQDPKRAVRISARR